MQIIIECDTADEYEEAEELRGRIERLVLNTWPVVVDAPV